MAKSITVSSALKEYGNFFTVSYHGHKNEVGKAEESGVCLVIFDIDSKEESPNFQRIFDFSKDNKNQISDQFCSLINSVKEGSYIVIGLKGEGKGITKEVKETIGQLGSNEIFRLGLKDSWAMMVKKNFPFTIHEYRYPDKITFNQTF